MPATGTRTSSSLMTGSASFGVNRSPRACCGRCGRARGTGRGDRDGCRRRRRRSRPGSGCSRRPGCCWFWPPWFWLFWRSWLFCPPWRSGRSWLAVRPGSGCSGRPGPGRCSGPGGSAGRAGGPAVRRDRAGGPAGRRGCARHRRSLPRSASAGPSALSPRRGAGAVAAAASSSVGWASRGSRTTATVVSHGGERRRRPAGWRDAACARRARRRGSSRRVDVLEVSTAAAAGGRPSRPGGTVARLEPEHWSAPGGTSPSWCSWMAAIELALAHPAGAGDAELGREGLQLGQDHRRQTCHLALARGAGTGRGRDVRRPGAVGAVGLQEVGGVAHMGSFPATVIVGTLGGSGHA